MLSEYVLFCAPYRFDSDYLSYINKDRVKKDLFSAIMPGVNIVTKKLIAVGIKNNFGVVDKATLLSAVDEIHKTDGEYSSVLSSDKLFTDDENKKSSLQKLVETTKGKNAQGFDDCRIIDVITKAYACGFVNDDEFNELFLSHAERIEQSYDSWKQYLASCVVGKLEQLCADSVTIVSKEEFIQDIYNYCIMPTNVFAFSTFWKDSDLSDIAPLLASILGVEHEIVSGKNSESKGVPSTALMNMLEEDGSKDFLDKDKYAYLSELAEFVLWQPMEDQELGWMVTPDGEKQEEFLLPSELQSIESACQFWYKYKDLGEIAGENVFAIFAGVMGGIKAVFTENGVYTFKKKLFGKGTWEGADWSAVDLSCKLGDFSGTQILLDKKAILGVMSPSFATVGLQKFRDLDGKEQKAIAEQWTAKMNNVLKNIPNKINEFKKK